MFDNNKAPWQEFSTLARTFPECNAVKLTVALQRRFIEQQQRQIMALIKDLTGKRV